MNIEYTITISKEDLEALYRAYLIEYYGDLKVQSVAEQKEMAEQKDRIKKIVNEALNSDGNK